MNRVKSSHALKIAASAMCTVLCTLLIALWVRSYQWSDALLGLKRNTGFGVVLSSETGQLVFAWNAPMSTLWPVSQFELRTVVTTGHERPIRTRFGFGYLNSQREFGLGAPHWFIALLTAIVAAAPWMRWTFSLRALLVATTLIAVALGGMVIAGL